MTSALCHVVSHCATHFELRMPASHCRPSELRHQRLTSACASHPDFDRRHRNLTGSAGLRCCAARFAGYTAGSELHRPRAR